MSGIVDRLGIGDRKVERRSLFCPTCLSPLQDHGPDALQCGPCGDAYPVREGVPMLGADHDFYYAEIPRAAMERYLEHARRGEFATVFEADDAINPWPFILGSHFDRTRGSWMFATELSPRGTRRKALDFGAGWGINAACLAPHFEEVVAVELSWHRVLNLRLWSQAQGLENVTPICGGDTPRLPFPNDYFDLVVLNGVIEWIPVGQHGDPREHQVTFLREIDRITKPGGELFLASENRYAYQYWTGRPDDHTNLLFGSLLPRRLANVYSKLKNKRPYQNYTYSVGQYRRLLAEAGFDHTKFHGLIPAHRLFHKVFPLSIGRIVDREESRGSKIKTALLQRSWAARLASALGMRASRTTLSPSYLERLTRQLEVERLILEPLEPEPYKLLATNFSTKVGIRSRNGAAGLLAKIPLSDFKAMLQVNALREQQRWQAGEVVSPYVSPVLRELEFEGMAISVETLCLERQLPGEKSAAVYHAVDKILRRFAQSKGATTVANVFGDEMAEFRRYLPQHQTIIGALLADDVLRSLPTCYQHGDFHWGNLLTENNQQLAQIVDWEWASPEGYPLSDLLHLITNHTEIGLSRRYVAVLRDVLRGRLPNAQLERMLRELTTELGIGPAHLELLTLVYLYHTLYKHWAGSVSYGLGRRFLSAHGHDVANAIRGFAGEVLYG